MKKMMLKNQLLNMVKKSLIDLPVPTSISNLWNAGFVLSMIMMTQIITGLVLSMNYTPNVDTAFCTMMMIMRDTNLGWSMRMLHMNGASFMFMLMYMHLMRGIYFNSPTNQKKVWMTGMLMLILTMATAFLGYVLPWGQMSMWGATVITGLITAMPYVGNDILMWLWGGPTISQPTLNRFFSLHFILPLLMMMFVMLHLMMLHEKGSSVSTTTVSNVDKMKFNTMFTIKDIVFMVTVMMIMLMWTMNLPYWLGDVENFSPANPLVTPKHIQPEWYFLFAYAILRSVPSKLGGVLLMILSICILMMPMVKKNKSSKLNMVNKMKFFLMLSILVMLTWIGSKPVEPPYEKIGMVLTLFYFVTMMI